MLVDIKEFNLRNNVEKKLYQDKQLLFTRILNFQILMAALSIIFSCLSPFFSSEPALPYKQLEFFYLNQFARSFAFRYPAWYPIDWRNDLTNFLIVYIYQFIGIIFVAYSIILMEAYGVYLMIVAGSHLDILANRLATFGYELTHDDLKVHSFQLIVLEKSLRVDCLETYTKIVRLEGTIWR